MIYQPAIMQIQTAKNPLTAMRRGVIENMIASGPWSNNALISEIDRQSLYQKRADARFEERQKMTQAQQPSPVQVTPMPNAAGTSSQPNYPGSRSASTPSSYAAPALPGARPDYEASRRRRKGKGLAALRAM
jgi:hypothetical protein